MAWNPTTQNLLQSIDISDALDKAIDYLDNQDSDDAQISIPSSNPFSLRMRMYRFVKAYALQMKDNPDVDENKYNHLHFKETKDNVIIKNSFEKEQLVLVTDKGETL